MSIPEFDPADRAEQERALRPGDDVESGPTWPADVPTTPGVADVPDEADPADVAEQRTEAADEDDDEDHRE